MLFETAFSHGRLHAYTVKVNCVLFRFRVTARRRAKMWSRIFRSVWIWSSHVRCVIHNETSRNHRKQSPDWRFGYPGDNWQEDNGSAAGRWPWPEEEESIVFRKNCTVPGIHIDTLLTSSVEYIAVYSYAVHWSSTLSLWTNYVTYTKDIPVPLWTLLICQRCRSCCCNHIAPDLYPLSWPRYFIPCLRFPMVFLHLYRQIFEIHHSCILSNQWLFTICDHLATSFISVWPV